MCIRDRYESNEWNGYSRFEDDLARTTNIAEAFHRKLQCSNFNGDHPTLFQLGLLLLDINQRSCHLMKQHITAGAPPKKQNKKDAERKENLKRLFQKFSNGEMELEDYLVGCGGNVFTL